MIRNVRMFMAAFSLALPLLAAPEHLPLQLGNSWLYRVRGSVQTFTIQVGTPAVFDRNVYYRLTGYVTQPVWARFHDDGSLYARDEENDRDVLLTSFEAVPDAWANAPYRVCEQESQIIPTRDPSVSATSLVLRYRSFHCADAGVQEETYAANIGLTQRTETSIAGPRIYDLVSARIGNMTYQADPGAELGLSLQKQPGDAKLTATLQLRVRGSDPVTLRYLSSQEFDVILRAADGSILWQWSEGKVFTASVRDQQTLGRTWSVDVPLQDRSGNALVPGTYEVEAWIASGYERPQFSATAPLIVSDPKELKTLRVH